MIDVKQAGGSYAALLIVMVMLCIDDLMYESKGDDRLCKNNIMCMSLPKEGNYTAPALAIKLRD